MVKSEPKDKLLRQILRPLSIIVPLAIAGNIVYIIITTQPEILQKLLSFNILFLVLSIVMAFIPWFTHSLRTLLWARIFARNIGFIQGLKVAMATEIGSAVTPTSTGGGYIKLALLSAYGFSVGEATLVTLLGSLEDAAFFIIAIPLAVYLSHSWSNPNFNAAIKNLLSHWPWVLGFVVAIILLYIILFQWRKAHKENEHSNNHINWRHRIRNTVLKYKNELKQASKFVMRKGKSTFLTCILLTGIGWCCRYGAISALSAGLGLNTDPILFFLLQWIVFTTMTVVPTPGAIGGAEVSFAIIYSGIFPPGLIPMITCAWRLVTFYLLVAVGGVVLSLSGIGFSGKDNIRVLEEKKT